MKKSMTIIGSILLIAFLTTNGFAFGPGMGKGGGGCQGNAWSAWNDLPKEKKEELSALHQKFVDDTYELRASKFRKHEEIRLLLETSNPERAKLSKLSQELLDIEKQFREKQIDFELSAKKIAPNANFGGRGFGPGHGRGGMMGPGQNCFQSQENGCPFSKN